jgi:ADP-heptose:LPS heptosyltransferase
VDVMMTSSYVDLYHNHPAIECVIPYDQKYLFRNPLRFLFLINRLRDTNYDAVFSSNNPDAFSVSQAIFNRLVTKNRSVGFDQKESYKFYTDIVAGNTNIHYAQSQYELWRHFDKNAKYSTPKLYFLEETNVSPQKSLLLWLGATGSKILSEALVNSIVEEIEKLNIDYHLALGPHDRAVLDFYTKPLRNKIISINLDLKGIARYFLSYRCIIMPDTGPMHLVAALEIPLVQIFVDSNVIQYGYVGSDKYIVDRELNAETFSKFIKTQIS